MKSHFLLMSAISVLVGACAYDDEPDTRYIIIRETDINRELATGADEYCESRGMTAVLVQDESGDDRVTFYCR